MPKAPQRPFSIRIFVPDGDPDGLRLVEKSNWTGLGVVFNRTIYRQSVVRPEFDKTGVYILVGTTEGSSLPTLYVGEGDPVKSRLNPHFSKKDFWNWAVFFVSKDNNLNKAHVKHLEARLLERAKAAKQCKLDNAQPSLPPTLSEAEVADVESFLLDMLSIFPLLGLNVFEKIEAPRKTGPPSLPRIEGDQGDGVRGRQGVRRPQGLAGREVGGPVHPPVPQHAEEGPA